MFRLREATMTDCQKQIENAMAELRQALEHAARLGDTVSSDVRESVEADICLTSRSADFDFYTWVVLHGEIDGPAEAELDALFLKALAVMGAGRFRDSVETRYKGFKDYCAEVRARCADREPAPLPEA
jgi:hypothetical protein